MCIDELRLAIDIAIKLGEPTEREKRSFSPLATPRPIKMDANGTRITEEKCVWQISGKERN